MSGLVLYTYYRSSCSYRVRIALAIKGIDYESRYVHLLRDGGENWQPEYVQHNPQGLVPTLVDGQRILIQSLAIIEYLEEAYPEPPLLPVNAGDRAYIRALAQIVISDIQPLNNLRILDYLEKELAINPQQLQSWYRHWVEAGLQAVEALLERHRQDGTYCYGDTPTIADICLIPQVYNALRYNCNLDAFPIICRIYGSCTSQPAFLQAAPENQADAE